MSIMARISDLYYAIFRKSDLTKTFSFYHLTILNKYYLSAGPEKFRTAWRVSPSRRDDSPKLILCIPNEKPETSFLLAFDGRHICLIGDHVRGPAISALVVSDSMPNVVKLRHPITGTYLGFRPQAPGIHPASIVFDHQGENNNLEQIIFKTHPTTIDAFGLGARRILIGLAAYVRAGMSARAAFALLREKRLPLSIAEAMLRMLPAGELTSAGAHVVAHAGDRSLLARALPNDPWLTQFLPGIVQWDNRGRPSATILSAPSTVDPLLRIHDTYGGPSLGFTLHSFARRAITPRRQSAVFTKARNDGAYLLDWVAYHRSLGFDHIFVYSNDNDDGSDTLLELLARHGIITWIQSEIVSGTNPQDKANNHILNLVPEVLDYRWLLSLDSDEYLGLHRKFDNVGNFIDWHEKRPVDAIALCWLLYGASKSDGWRDASSVERFSFRETPVNPHVKCFMRPGRFWAQHPHFPYSPLDEPFVFRTEKGRIHHGSGDMWYRKAFAASPSADVGWVNHYIFRSALEACWKLIRGRADWDDNTAFRRSEYLKLTVSIFMSLCDPERVVEDRRTQARLPQHNREHARLLELSGIAVTNAEIKAQFEKRMRAASRTFIEEPGLAEHAEFREIVATVLNR